MMQGDGNMVVRAPGNVPLWSTQTNALENQGAFARMQFDGNLVVIAPGGRAVWDSKTAGRGLSTLIIQHDGNAVVFGANGATWSWKTGVIPGPNDTTPPETTITAGPPQGSTTNDSTPTFAFSSNEPGSTFQCRIGSGAFAGCSSPHTTAAVGDGQRTFEVRATDPTANTDQSPAARTFTVDTVAPQTTITAGPAEGSITTDSTPTFAFTSSELGSTFSCRIDGGSSSPCGSPFTTAMLADGQHTFSVAATDAVSNADASPATRTFTINTAVPLPPPPPVPPPPIAGASQRVALVPHARGLSSHGGTFPTSRFPGGYAPTFTNVAIEAIRDSPGDPLTAGYDTVLLNGVCDIAGFLSNAAFKSRLEGFVSRGGKLIIWDSECKATNYANFAIPFVTNNPGAKGSHNGVLIDREANQLSSANPASPSYVNVAAVASDTDAVGDANVFTTYDRRWFTDLQATNVNGVNGPVQTYARLGAGLVIYSGLDKDDIGSSFDPASTSGDDHLARIWMLELLQPWNPDGLPASVTATNTYKYVALGDSFAAGEGIEPFFQKGTNQCHRSTKAYPTLVELPGLERFSIFQLRQAGTPGIAWGFQACASALANHLLPPGLAPDGKTISNVIGDGIHRDVWRQLALPGAAPDPGNVNRLNVDPETDLLTLTIGGNDMAWPKVLTECALNADCTTGDFKDTKHTLEMELKARRDRLSGELDGILQGIRRQAPRARVLVTGYPNLVPRTAKEQNCVALIQRTVGLKPNIRPTPIGPFLDAKKQTVGFSHREQDFFRQATRKLNDLIANRTQNAGATFVPVDKIFAGHEICGKLDPDWINYATPTRRGKLKVSDQGFHPKPEGQRDGYAAAINNVLNPGRTAPTFGPGRRMTVRAAANGLVRLRLPLVLCPIRNPACVVTVTARARIRRAGRAAKALVKIGRSTFSVLPEKAHAIEFKLNKAGRNALKRTNEVRATVKTVAIHGSQTASKTLKVIVKPPKRR